MRSFALTLLLIAFFSAPALAFADAGHAASEPHGTTLGVAHIHEDGTVEVHADGGFELATPWSSRWWMLVGISLILMGLLSIRVQKFLVVA
jgi:hypothetical protein